MSCNSGHNSNFTSKNKNLYFSDIYDLNQGFTCKTNYVPITSNWQDCKEAAESLGFNGDKVAHVDYENSAWGTTRPQGCFQADNLRFHFNEAAGGGAIGNDKILCIRQDLGTLMQMPMIKVLIYIYQNLLLYIHYCTPVSFRNDNNNNYHNDNDNNNDNDNYFGAR